MDPDVLIVGAGPTGLFLASELGRSGLSTTVVDESEGPSVHSKALAVHARTLEVFASRQFGDAFVERGLPIQQARILSGSTERAQLPLDEIESPYSFILSVPQSVTERLLIDELQSVGGRVHWGSEVVDVTSRSDGVTARLDTADGERSVHARWVVGCDGAHSRVRSAAGIGWEGTDIDNHFAFVDAEVEWNVLEAETAHLCLLDGGRVCLFIPLPGGQYRVICPLAGPPRTDVDEAFLRDWLTVHVDSDLALSSIDWVSHFTVRQRLAETYRSGRVCLAGDAAHAHSPVGGQGMNMGLQDAHNLAWKLAAVLDGSAEEDLLDTYELERRPWAERVVRWTGRGTRFAGRSSWGAHALRSIAFFALSQLGPLRRHLLGVVSQTNIQYARSPLVCDRLGGVTGGLQGGQFAPNLELDDGTRLYSRLSPQTHVALLPGDGAVPAPLAEAGLPVGRLSEASSPTGRGRREAVFVVRPDGYVGYAGAIDDFRSLETYLTRERWGQGA